jgi:hypothetical protein
VTIDIQLLSGEAHVLPVACGFSTRLTPLAWLQHPGPLGVLPVSPDTVCCGDKALHGPSDVLEPLRAHSP